MNIYGILCNDTHIDVSKSLKGAKQYATRNGFNVVTKRFGVGLGAVMIAYKEKNKWFFFKNE